MKLSYQVENLEFSYPGQDNGKKFTLGPLSFKIPQGKTTFICGRSGSGKSTLLAIMGLLRTEFEGKVRVHDLDLRTKGNNKKELSKFRMKNIGFALQKGRLLPYLTVSENSTFILDYLDYEAEEKQKRSQGLFDKLFRVEIEEDQDKDKDRQGNSYTRILSSLPEGISGGQYQRAALARALINFPIIVLADEPTGNLDVNSGEKVMLLLKDYLKNRAGSTVVVVSHDLVYARLYADKIIVLKKGLISADIEKQEDEDSWKGNGISIQASELEKFLNSKIKDDEKVQVDK